MAKNTNPVIKAAEAHFLKVQTDTLQNFETWKKEFYLAGKSRDMSRRALILQRCLVAACGARLPLPDWASGAIVNGVREGRQWGEIFGPVAKKRGRPSFQMTLFERASIVWSVEILVEEGRPLNDALFSDVARELGYGEDKESTIRRLYYEIKRNGFTSF